MRIRKRHQRGCRDHFISCRFRSVPVALTLSCANCIPRERWGIQPPPPPPQSISFDKADETQMVLFRSMLPMLMTMPSVLKWSLLAINRWVGLGIRGCLAALLLRLLWKACSELYCHERIKSDRIPFCHFGQGLVNAVLLEDSDLPSKSLMKPAAKLREICTDMGLHLIIENRVDIAVSASADGTDVHRLVHYYTELFQFWRISMECIKISDSL